LARAIESCGKTVKGAGVHMQNQVIKVIEGVVKRTQRTAGIGCHLSCLKAGKPVFGDSLFGGVGQAVTQAVAAGVFLGLHPVSSVF
jgi:hypothetical protein